MGPNTDRKLLAPLAGSAIIAVLAIPAAIAFIALTAGREDAARNQRMMSAVAAGYLESLITIERHQLRAAGAYETPPYPGQAMFVFDRQGGLVSRSGESPPDGEAQELARETVLNLGAQADPAALQSYSELAWTPSGPSLIVAVPDTLNEQVRVGVRPITQQLLEQELGGALDLQGIAIHQTAEPPRLGTSQSPFSLTTGRTGYISWQTDDLNTVILNRLAPVMLLAAILLAAMGMWLFRRTRRLTQEVLASQAQAKHLALHDPLTGLANRAFLTNRADLALDQRRRQGGMVAFYVLDLDQFKQVNDSLGHAAGDALIRRAAERLLEVSRVSDTAARMGGDEFALVAVVTSQKDAERIAQRLVATLRGPVEVPGGTAHLSVSVGLTLVGEEPLDSAEALRQADLALYRAKAEGRGRYASFEPGMDESLKLRRQTEVDLRAAIAAGDLEVHYQPQVTTRSSRLHSVEALVRWTHPQHGSVSPAYFIPIAEESGLIHALGDFVLRRACQDGRRWPGLKVAVNISPCQLRTVDFADRCRAIVEEVGAQPSDIELEITEGVLMEQGEDVPKTLRQLREMGFTIALDDFGTGYSSLSYLNVYAVDKIKIDRSFVERIGAHQDSEKVIRAIIRLGKALGLTVIAEGVQTEEQRAELASSGCGLIQGYLHAAPGAPEAIDDMLKAQGRHAA